MPWRLYYPLEEVCKNSVVCRIRSASYVEYIAQKYYMRRLLAMKFSKEILEELFKSGHRSI